MNKATTNKPGNPATETIDPEVPDYREALDGRSPLDELVHEGARRML